MPSLTPGDADCFSIAVRTTERREGLEAQNWHDCKGEMSDGHLLFRD
jgi:hypothetical protein